MQKVIENLQSRFTILKIKKFEKEELKNFMNMIQQKEGIDIDDITQDFLLNISNYSIPILIHFMEKFYLMKEPIRIANATELCSTISIHVFDKYIELLKEKDLTGAIEYIYNTYNQGYSVIDILDTFCVYIKLEKDWNDTNKLKTLTEDQKYAIIEILCKYITVFYEIHEHELELAFFTNNLLECF